MHAYESIAGVARPPYFLVFYKIFDTMFFDIVQVFEHAHFVVRAIALVERFEAHARVHIADIAKVGVFAISFVAVGDNALCAIFAFFASVVSAAGAVVFLALVRHTNAAVHAARRNHKSIHSCFHEVSYRAGT